MDTIGKNRTYSNMTAETQFHEACVGIVCHSLFMSLAHRDIATCRLPQHLGKAKGPPSGSLSSLLLFRLSTLLCRLRVPTRSKTLYLVE